MTGKPTSTPTGVRDILTSDENYGSSLAFLVTYGDGSRGIFKPGDPPGDNPDEPVGISDADAEVAAYRLAKLLGYDAIPFTDYSDGTPVAEIAGMSIRQGSVQSWVEKATVECRVSGIHKQGSRKAVTQRTIMALFDQVIGNHDRHGENVVRDRKGKWWAVDHGLAFWYAEGINVREILRRGSFDCGRPSSWRAMQLKVMAETLAEWGRVPQQEVEATMASCDKGEDTGWVCRRIRELTAEVQSGRWA